MICTGLEDVNQQRDGAYSAHELVLNIKDN